MILSHPIQGTGGAMDFGVCGVLEPYSIDTEGQLLILFSGDLKVKCKI